MLGFLNTLKHTHMRKHAHGHTHTHTHTHIIKTTAETLCVGPMAKRDREKRGMPFT
jgi:hypothetical protein